jgi:hypothetical protein
MKIGDETGLHHGWRLGYWGVAASFALSATLLTCGRTSEIEEL